MNEQPLLPEPEADLLGIDARCDRFEDAWIAGGQPRIEDCLDTVAEPERSELLRELILLDVYYRRQSGDDPQAVDYHNRFPALDCVWLAGAVLPSAVSRSDAEPPIRTALRQSVQSEPPASDPVAVATLPQIGRYRVERILGEGGFGRVYLAHDDQLQRPVAIKVPHRKLVARPEEAEAYLTEARNVAKLDHPHIVPVFDVGSTGDWPCFVVSKFIDGCTLAQRIKEDRPAVRQAANLVATVGEALHCAHRQGLVHRDIKPGNILLDSGGQPHLADFGLALNEAQVGHGPKYAGTPAYMSPEQARGEGHRVDGRSDIFSLGVVFYELLTGRRPFQGHSREELREQITDCEPRPPRQYDDRIPKELERICQKALAKRVGERYSTAIDLADELRHFLAEQAVTPSRTLATPSSDSQPLKIVPKGLRSFDAQDADFFLELLPGPRDRHGLPDSLRFWKTHSEETDRDNTFAVGLIYGPSGCGKSSLVKAGLLPRLSDMVMTVYIEATGGETETRLLHGLRKRCPTLPVHLGLTETLAALRHGHGLPAGKKVLIILDQFEQWLHAEREDQHRDLVQGLRQCDGGRVQCLVLVRDDFWLATTRFLGALEIALLQGHNTALADLFDLDHATKVLAAFGRAFGKLPENPGETSKEQRAFLKQAVSGLAQEGKVICVRLALFAEMMKGKPWTPTSLKQVGGTEGIGVTFLEETFSAPTANPKHRLHQQAARAVLKALLPESGTDIKGHMRSDAELLEASGYAGRSKEFEDLLHLLDSELRLLTPTDPEGAETAGHQPATTAGGKYYQLTHDYLVPSLRDWLTRKQKETRRGRAELLLADRASVWNARPENRQLPSLPQWVSIQLLSQRQHWTAPQRRMVRRATWYHAVRSAALAVLLAVLTLTGLGIWSQVLEQKKENHAAGLVQRLLDADMAQVPSIIAQMEDYRAWVDPRLRQEYEKAAKGSREKLHTSMSLLPIDPTQVDYLYERSLNAEPTELAVIREILLAYRDDDLVERLWKVLGHAQEDPDRGFRAACVLATFDPSGGPKGERWGNASKFVTDQLLAGVQKNPSHYAPLLEMLRPIREKLLGSLAEAYRSRERPESDRSFATTILADYASDQSDLLADLLLDADEKQFVVLYPKFKARGERGLTLLHAEVGKQLHPQWTDSPLNPSWKEPDAELKGSIEAAHGIVAERFAFCQTLPLEEFIKVAESLRQFGYRPIRFRPYGHGEAAALAGGVLVAAVWTRDGLEWQMAHGLSAEAIRKRDAENRKQSFQPVDVTGYLSNGKEHHAALWLKGAASDTSRGADAPSAPVMLELGLDEKQLQGRDGTLRKEGYRQSTYSQLASQDGNIRICGIWTTVPDDKKNTAPPYQTFTGTEPDYTEENYLGSLQVEVQVSNGVNQGRRYAGLWHESAALTSTEIHGPDPVEHLAGCRSLRAQGYRPASLSVAEMGTGQRVSASVWHQPVVPEDAKEKLAKRQANAAVALLKMDQPEQVWPLLKHSSDPRVRSYLIHRLGPLGANPKTILKRLEEEKEVSSRRALLLSLGEFDNQEFPPVERDALIPKLLDFYRQNPDPGIHGCAAWLLRRWGQQDKLKQTDQDLATGKVEGERRWYVNKQGQTFVVIPGPVEFVMGSPPTEQAHGIMTAQHRRRIGSTFALATTHVTVAQIKRFNRQLPPEIEYCPEPDCPVVLLSFYQVAAYCNWLSAQEGLTEDQWCFVRNNDGKFEAGTGGMQFAPDYLRRTGYRLPTQAEWEYACRAGAATSRYYGQSDELLEKYAWYSKNSRNRTWPVGSLKPNDLGLFDMHGQAWVWCLDRDKQLPRVLAGGNVWLGKPSDDIEDTLDGDRVVRGGAFNSEPGLVRSTNRDWVAPGIWYWYLGFRVARTIR